MSRPIRTFFVRSLFPSWRLFDEIGDVPRLFVRIRAGETEAGEWRLALAAPPRRWWSLFLNPSGNEALALMTVLERLVADVNASPDHETQSLSRSVNYRVIERHVRSTIPKEAKQFQFKIDIVRAASSAPFEILVSEEFDA